MNQENKSGFVFLDMRGESERRIGISWVAGISTENRLSETCHIESNKTFF